MLKDDDLKNSNFNPSINNQNVNLNTFFNPYSEGGISLVSRNQNQQITQNPYEIGRNDLDPFSRFQPGMGNIGGILYKL